MARSELYLIRHGESAMNTNAHLVGGRSNETPLTDRGVEQARRLGTYFLKHSITPTQIFSSPAVRTLQTAEYVLAAMNVESSGVTIVDEIQEMDQGSYVGRPRTEVYTADVLSEIERQGKDFKLPGGESMNEVGARMLEWVERSVSTDDDARTFVFGHGLAIRTLASTLHDWSRAQTFESVTENTSYSRFVYEDGRWQLDVLGATPHFEE